MEKQQEKKRLRKCKVGVVVSDKMDKTVGVLVERTIKHPVFHKEVKRRKKFLAHDETNECKSGDRVRIEESRPLSRRKRWNVVEVIIKAK